MARDSISIGATPCDEPCQQIGTDEYSEQFAILECQTFRDQIRRVVGPEPGTVSLRVIGQSHDFGRYFEVVCSFDTSDDESVSYAFRCENEAPANWDQESKSKLWEAGHPMGVR